MGKRYMLLDVERDGVKVQVPVLPEEFRNSLHSKFMQDRLHTRINWIIDDAKRKAHNTEILKNAVQEPRPEKISGEPTS